MGNAVVGWMGFLERCALPLVAYLGTELIDRAFPRETSVINEKREIKVTPPESTVNWNEVATRIDALASMMGHCASHLALPRPTVPRGKKTLHIAQA